MVAAGSVWRRRAATASTTTADTDRWKAGCVIPSDFRPRPPHEFVDATITKTQLIVPRARRIHQRGFRANPAAFDKFK